MAIIRDPERQVEFWARHKAATEPWGLTLPADPRRDFDEARVFFKHRTGVEILSSWEAPAFDPDTKWPGYPYFVALKFNFKYSIDVQVEIAADMLRNFQRLLEENFDYHPIEPKRRAFRVRQFPLYVRILDAEIAGATIGEMGRVLLPNRADKRNNLKLVRDTARRMSSEGYRELLLLPPRAMDPG